MWKLKVKSIFSLYPGFGRERLRNKAQPTSLSVYLFAILKYNIKKIIWDEWPSKNTSEGTFTLTVFEILLFEGSSLLSYVRGFSESIFVHTSSFLALTEQRVGRDCESINTLYWQLLWQKTNYLVFFWNLQAAVRLFQLR